MNNLLAGGVPAYQSDIKNPLIKGVLQNLFEAPDASILLSAILPKIIGLLMVFGVVAFLFMLIWGAVSWILSGGDKAHVESARARITSALTGLVLMFSTFAIIKLIETFFGIDILSIDIGPLVIQ
ncbi:MAG TPA: hypothetical protein VI795_00365 [Patescibacteria group bacterium]|nr:hypothetical protein [Patescibacteria group bacterium]